MFVYNVFKQRNRQLKSLYAVISLDVIGSYAIHVYCGINLLKPTSYVMHQQVKHSRSLRSAHTLLICFVFISEQTATWATYIIKWLVFITEMKSVYSAVRTGPLN